MDPVSALLASDDFIPHGMCLLWRRDLLILHAASDSITALAYYSIPFALVYFVWRRRDLVYRWMFVLFGIFILACGTTHVFGVITLWQPDYVTDGIIKAVTAVASIGTAALLWYIMPQALAIPSRREMDETNRRLQKEIGERLTAERTIREMNAGLEAKVGERTAELEAALEQKALFVRETHHRVKNNLQIILSLLNLQLSTAGPELREKLEDTLARIRSIGLVHEQLYRSDIGSIELKGYLNTLLAQVSDIHGARRRGLDWSVEGDSVIVDIDHAVPIGLICNEVIANALKHAFRDGQAPSLEMSISEGKDTYRVVIRDNGSGLPADFEARSRRSMGIQVIYGLAGQIGATVSFKSAAGTTFVLELPRHAAEAPESAAN